VPGAALGGGLEHHAAFAANERDHEETDGRAQADPQDGQYRPAGVPPQAANRVSDGNGSSHARIASMGSSRDATSAGHTDATSEVTTTAASPIKLSDHATRG